MASPKIVINIGANTSNLRRDMKKADGIVSSFTKTAGAALTGLGIAAGAAAVKIGVDSVKAAIEDDAAARKLTKTLENTIHATKAQSDAVGEYIDKTALATGVADDELRPAFARLMRSTKDITKSQDLLNLALDISAGTGKPLQNVVTALSKGYDGNSQALGRLGLGIDSAKLKQKDFSKVTDDLRHSFKGFADQEANTMEGKLKRLTLRWSETKEEMGAALLEGLQPLMDWVNGEEGQKFMDDFMLAFKDAAKAVAESLPGILENIKKIGKAAGGLGLDPTKFMDPRMMAAASAFRLAPGPIQLKAVAAIAAYAIAGNADKNDAEKRYEATVNKHGGAGSAWTAGYMYAPNTQTTQDWYGNTMTRAEYDAYRSEVAVADMNARASRINITVNGAVDPASTAKAVAAAMARASRMGVNTKSIGVGS